MMNSCKVIIPNDPYKFTAIDQTENQFFKSGGDKKKKGKLLISHRYNRLPLLHS